MTRNAKIPVRVAIALFPDGAWRAAGHSNTPDENLINLVKDNSTPHILYWLTGSVPLTNEIKATITEVVTDTEQVAGE